MLYIFIDESGQFVKTTHERYFVMACFEVTEPRKTRKHFRAWCKSKFPKRLRFQSEIKFSDSSISYPLRLQTLHFIAKLGIKVRYVYFKIENIPHEFWRKEKLESGFLYLYTITNLLDRYVPFNCSISIICDQRNLRGISVSQFKHSLIEHIFSTNLGLNMGSNAEVRIENSMVETNIQIVDWIVGAIARFLNNKPFGVECFEIIESILAEPGIELFRK